MDRNRREAEVDEYFTARAVALRRTAYLIVRDWHLAEDMVQGTFVRLYTAWPRVRGDTVDAYARRTLVNLCISHLRKHRRETVTDRPPDRVHRDYSDAATDIHTALALLPAQQRAIVALRFLDDLSVREVAHALDIAEGTVKSQTARAIQTLRKQLPEIVLTEEQS